MADASVTGPVTGGSHGWAFGASARDLEALGYVGGIRLPDVEVPVATLTAETGIEGLGGLGGARHDFDAATVRKLYASRDDDVARHDAAVDGAVRVGVVLETDAADLRRRARERSLPLG